MCSTDRVNEPGVDVGFTADILRTADVNRWHAVKTLRPQSNAEHMYLVTWIGRLIAKRIYPDMTMEENYTLLMWLMVHDVPESITGDLPTPIKRYLERYFPEGVDPLDDLESEICPEYKFWKSKVKGTPLRRIAKLADQIEMVIFLQEEGIGKYAKTIQERLSKSINNLIVESHEKYPELKWLEIHNFLSEIAASEGTHIEFEWNHQQL